MEKAKDRVEAGTELVPVTAAPLRTLPDLVIQGPAEALVVHALCCDEHDEVIIYINRKAA